MTVSKGVDKLMLSHCLRHVDWSRTSQALMLGDNSAQVYEALLSSRARVWRGSEAANRASPKGGILLFSAQLPFPSSCLDLLVSWHQARFVEAHENMLNEFNRVLRAGGILVIVSTVVPGSHLRGKKGRRLRAAGEFINAVESLNNRAHFRYASVMAWQENLNEAGFCDVEIDVAEVRHDFADWCAPDMMSELDQLRLRALILQAPETADAYLQPLEKAGQLTFREEVACIGAVRAHRPARA